MTVATLDRDVDAFAKMVANLDDTTDLARPALVLAADEYPGLNIRRYLNKLDDLADEALLQSVVVGAKNECEAARRLARFLFDTHGFRGNEQAFYDPANSFLNEVLDRRAGIPISLSLVLIEVGRRLGVPLVGIGFPGHFLVGCGPHRRNEYLLLDPYCQGKIVDWDECERLQAMGMEFDPEEHLSPVSNKQFFERILNNLKAIYIRRRDVKRALRTITRLTMLNGDFALDYRALANLFATEGSHEEARACLRSYLDLEIEGEETDAVRQFLEQLLDRRALRN